MFRRPGRPRKDVGADIDQYLGHDVPSERLRLRRMDPGSACRDGSPLRGDRRRRRDGGACRTQSVHARVSRPRRVPACDAKSPTAYTCDRTEFIGRQRLVGAAGSAWAPAASRTEWRRTRRLRGIADRSRNPATRLPTNRVCAGPGREHGRGFRIGCALARRRRRSRPAQERAHRFWDETLGAVASAHA